MKQKKFFQNFYPLKWTLVQKNVFFSKIKFMTTFNLTQCNKNNIWSQKNQKINVEEYSSRRQSKIHG